MHFSALVLKIKIPRTRVDYTVSFGNRTKLDQKATKRAKEISSELPADMTEDWLLQTSLHNWTSVMWKMCVNIYFEEKTLWSWHIWQNCCQKTTAEETKLCQKALAHKDTHRLDESKFKTFGSKRRIYVWWKVGQRATTLSITSTVKHGGGCVIKWGAFAYCKVRNLHKVKGKLNQTSFHSILQHHAIPSGIWLIGQGFGLM